MLTSEASERYPEFVNQRSGRAYQEGAHPYPVICYEIFMLDQAQRRSARNEADLFRQLSVDFDWNITRRQRSNYLTKLGSGSTLIITDPMKTILWTSRSFLAMTGFTRAESIGQTPRILQGPNTDPAMVLQIRESLRCGRAVEVDFLNYRKGGEPYWCRAAIDPLYNKRGELTHFLAVENEVK